MTYQLEPIEKKIVDAEDLAKAPPESTNAKSAITPNSARLAEMQKVLNNLLQFDVPIKKPKGFFNKCKQFFADYKSDPWGMSVALICSLVLEASFVILLTQPKSSSFDLAGILLTFVGSAWILLGVMRNSERSKQIAASRNILTSFASDYSNQIDQSELLAVTRIIAANSAGLLKESIVSSKFAVLGLIPLIIGVGLLIAAHL